MEKCLNHGLKSENSLLKSNDETQVPMDNQILEFDEEESFKICCRLYSLFIKEFY